jgi:hypothetical protein
VLLRMHGEVDERQLDYAWNDHGFGGDCVYALCQHVVRHMLEGTPLENEAADYLFVQKVEQAVYASAQHGCWVKLDE